MRIGIKKIIIGMMMVMGGVNLYSQDKHFSQFDAAPLYYNPALAGVYDGNHRFMGNLKHQWGTYKTYMLSYDRMLPKQIHLFGGFFGAGVMMNVDYSGETSYGSTELNIMPAFHRPIIDNKVMMSIGANIETKYYSVDEQKIVTPEQMDPATGEIIGEYNGMESEKSINADVSVGVNLHYRVLDKHPTNLGITWYHLAATEQSFVNKESTSNPRRFAINANSEIKLGEHFDLLPSLIYVYQKPSYELNFGTFGRCNLPSKVLKAIYLGCWYRIDDAVITGLAFDFPGFQPNHVFNLGISYDITTSTYHKSAKWDKSAKNNSFEVSLKYIIKYSPFEFVTPGIINEPVM